MPGLFARIKNWISNENLTDEDLNAEFNNILTNFEPSWMDGYSTDVPQKQEMSDPGEVGSETIGGSLAVEIEELRFMLTQITGEDFWYVRPARSLKTAGAELAFYLPMDGGDDEDAFRSTVQRGSIPAPACFSNGGSGAPLRESNFDATSPKFGKFSWLIGVVDFSQWSLLAVPGTSDTANRGTLSMHFYNVGPTSHLAYNPLLGIEFLLDGTGKLKTILNKQTTTSETAKATTTLQGVTTISGASAWQHALLKYSLNTYGGAGTDTLEQRVSDDDAVELDNQSSTVASLCKTGNGGVWFFGCKRQDPTWDKFSAMRIRPDAEAVSAWTFTGVTGNAAIDSDGILLLDSLSQPDGQAFFSKTGASGSLVVAQLGFVFEIKMRIKSVAHFGGNDDGEVEKPPFGVKVRDDGGDASWIAAFHKYGIYVVDNIAAPAGVLSIPVDTTAFHVYRFVQIGAILFIYVDGVYVGIMGLTTDSTANDLISWGTHDANLTTVDAEIEWVAYKGSAGTDIDDLAPVRNATTGKLSDIAMMKIALDDEALESKLATNRAALALGREKAVYPFWKALPFEYNDPSATDHTFTNAKTAVWDLLASIQSDGRTPIEITIEGDVGGDTEGMEITLRLASDYNNEMVLADQLHARFPSRRIVVADASERQPFSLSWKAIFPAGVNGVTLSAQSGNVAHTGTVLSKTLKARISYDRQE